MGSDILDAGPRPPGQIHQHRYTWQGTDSAGVHAISARYLNEDGTYVHSAPATLTIADRERDDQYALTLVEPSERVFAIGSDVELKFHAVSPTGFIS